MTTERSKRNDAKEDVILDESNIAFDMATLRQDVIDRLDIDIGSKDASQIRDFKFSEAVMFATVMQNRSICKEFLELILGIEVDRIEYSEVEHTILPDPLAKSVRMDVFIRSSDQAFNIEMQASNFSNLAGRLRYYQAALDTTLLRRGDKYEGFPQSFIIFVCTKDPFDKNIPRYTFKTTCAEDGSLDVDTRTTWVVMNAAAYKDCEDKRISQLLQYVSDGTVADTDLVKQIDTEVRHTNEDLAWKVNAMGLISIEERIMLDRRCAFQDGLDEGRAEGFAEGEARNRTLIEKLLADDRIDDLRRSTTDEAFCNQLYEEYGL